MVCPFFSVMVTHLFVTRTFDTVLCSSSASGSVMGLRPVSSRRQLKEQRSGVVLIDGLPLQRGGQLLPRFSAGSGRLLGGRWLDTVGAAYELVEQVCNYSLRLLGGRCAAEPP